MKRITLGTIALLGALAVVTCKLPSAIIGSRPGSWSGAEGRDGAAVKGDSLVSFQDLKHISPLAITKRDPSLPASDSVTVDGLALHGAPVGAPAAGAAPGLLHAGEGGPDGGLASALRTAVNGPGRAAESGIAVPGRSLEPGAGPPPTGEAGGDLRPAEPARPGEAATLHKPIDVAVSSAVSAGAGAGATAVVVAGADSQAEGGRKSESEGGEARQGFVMLEEAARRHPLWGELAGIDQEMEACKAEWQREVDASCVSRDDIERCYEAATRALLASEASRGDNGGDGGGGAAYAAVLPNRMKDMEARLREDAERRIEARAAELRAKLDDDLYAERARLNQEFDEFKDKTLKEYYLSLFNTQVKLKLLKLSEEERRALQEKLAKLTVEMEMKLDARRKEHDAAFAAYAERRRAEAEADIEAFRARQEQEVSEKLREERARLEESLADLLRKADSSLQEETERWRDEAVRRARIELAARRDQIAREFAAREAAFTAKYGKLKAQRDALYGAICDDIRKAARELEVGTGVKVSVLEHGIAPPGAGTAGGGRDVTEKVLEIIRNR